MKCLFAGFKNKIFNNHVRFSEEEKYISVNSAFGGFGIYKIKPITENKNKYNGYQDCNVILKDQTQIKKYYSKCEHVDFNLGLKNLGYDLYIKTNLINGEIKELYYPIKNCNEYGYRLKMFYFLNCFKCKTSVKVSIEDYRSKNRVYCSDCLKKTFQKIKKN